MKSKKDAADRCKHLLVHMDIKVLAQRFCEEARHFRGYTDHTIRRYRTTVELFCKQAGVADIPPSPQRRCVTGSSTVGRNELGAPRLFVRTISPSRSSSAGVESKTGLPPIRSRTLPCPKPSVACHRG